MNTNKYRLNFEDQSLFFDNLESLSEHFAWYDVYKKDFSIFEIKQNSLLDLTNVIINNKYFVDYLQMRKENLESQLNFINHDIKKLKEEIENLKEDYREAEINLFRINDFLNK